MKSLSPTQGLQRAEPRFEPIERRRRRQVCCGACLRPAPFVTHSREAAGREPGCTRNGGVMSDCTCTGRPRARHAAAGRRNSGRASAPPTCRMTDSRSTHLVSSRTSVCGRGEGCGRTTDSGRSPERPARRPRASARRIQPAVTDGLTRDKLTEALQKLSERGLVSVKAKCDRTRSAKRSWRCRRTPWATSTRSSRPTRPDLACARPGRRRPAVTGFASPDLPAFWC